MTLSNIVLRIFGPKQLIASVKSSVPSGRQLDSSGLGLWSSMSQTGLTPSSISFPFCQTQATTEQSNSCARR